MSKIDIVDCVEATDVHSLETDINNAIHERQKSGLSLRDLKVQAARLPDHFIEATVYLAVLIWESSHDPR